MAKYYARTHEWAEVDGDIATIGVSPYVGQALGDINYVEVPKLGSDVIVGDSVGFIESIGNSAEVQSPLSGTVLEVNRNLADDPGLIASGDPEKSWMYRLENIDLDELEELMSEEAYRKFLRKCK